MTHIDKRFGGYYANTRHWTTADGHLHTSVPTTVPTRWIAAQDARGRLVYVSGDYSIVRERYGATGRSYKVYRDNIELPASFTGRLRNAKEYAVRNAEGKHRVNVA